jgi:hypothetical protein
MKPVRASYRDFVKSLNTKEILVILCLNLDIRQYNGCLEKKLRFQKNGK